MISRLFNLLTAKLQITVKHCFSYECCVYWPDLFFCISGLLNILVALLKRSALCCRVRVVPFDISLFRNVVEKFKQSRDSRRRHCCLFVEVNTPRQELGQGAWLRDLVIVSGQNKRLFSDWLVDLIIARTLTGPLRTTEVVVVGNSVLGPLLFC